MEYNLPRKRDGVSYLSFTQIDMFIKSPTSYRKAYYGERRGLSSDYLTFGKKIAVALEQKEVDDPLLKDVTRYDTPEQLIDLDMGGFKLIGAIDSYDSVGHRILEYKTGVRTKTGKAPWNAEKVYKHKQLPIYSMAVHEMFGWVEDTCHLEWIETKKNIKKDIKIGGVTLKNTNKNLELTGYVESFKRVITQKERDDTKALIIRVAKEIHEDYQLHI